MSENTQIEPASGLSGGAGRVALFVEALCGLAVVGLLLGRVYGPFPTIVFTLAAGAVGYTGWMVFRMVGALGDPTLDVVGRVRNRDREKLEGEKALLLKGIKDLEVDFATGKMEEPDYRRLRATAEGRAVEIIRALRENEDRWRKAAERLVAEHSGGRSARDPVPDDVRVMPSEERSEPAPATATASLAAAAVFDDRPVRFEPHESGVRCAACGALSPVDARFCTGCGRPGQKEGTTPS